MYQGISAESALIRLSIFHTILPSLVKKLTSKKSNTVNMFILSVSHSIWEVIGRNLENRVVKKGKQSGCSGPDIHARMESQQNVWRLRMDEFRLY